MRISDWSSDVCSSDLGAAGIAARQAGEQPAAERVVLQRLAHQRGLFMRQWLRGVMQLPVDGAHRVEHLHLRHFGAVVAERGGQGRIDRNAEQARKNHQHHRSEEHTSELQSLMRNTYAVFCLKKKTS